MPDPGSPKTPGGEPSDRLQAEMQALEEKKKKGEITAFEYSAKRKALLRKAAGTPAMAPLPAPAATAAGAAPKDAGDAREQKKPDDAARTPKLPEAWMKAGEGRGRQPKAWSEGRRTDDPSRRVVHEPLGSGIGDGRSFLFLFGFKIHSPRDQEFLQKEIEHLDDDVKTLREAGYRVVVDQQATRQDFLDAVGGNGEGVAGLVPAAVYWSAHGLADGSVETCDGSVMKASDIDPAKVSPGLRLVIFASCYVGSRSRTWRKALGGRPLVVGWGRPVTIDRAVEFLEHNAATETDLDDLVRRYLLADTPLPGDGASSYAPVADPAAQGRMGDVPDRMRTVTEMLGAKVRTEPKHLAVDVPLEDGRWQAGRVFVIESTEPYSEGEPLLAVESDVGEISAIVDPQMLLGGLGGPGYARVALVQSQTDMPRIVTQGFLPLARVRDQDLAALIFQVCSWADQLERRVFGGDAA